MINNEDYYFLESDEECNDGTLLDTIDSTTYGLLMKRDPHVSNIRMITCTLAPNWHTLSRDEQHICLCENINRALEETNLYLYKCTFELTKKGVVHAHMIVDGGYDQEHKQLCLGLKRVGFICSRPVFDLLGAWLYINKAQSANTFSPLYSS